jgi:hypothetical protein
MSSQTRAEMAERDPRTADEKCRIHNSTTAATREKEGLTITSLTKSISVD